MINPFDYLRNQLFPVCKVASEVRKNKGKSVGWLNTWKFALALLACVELWTCFYWSLNVHELCPHEVDSDYVDNETKVETDGKEFPRHDNLSRRPARKDRECISASFLSGKTATRTGSDWRSIFSKIFMAALVLDTMIDSWGRATSYLSAKHRHSKKISSDGQKTPNPVETTRDRYIHMMHLLIVFVGMFTIQLLFLPLLMRGSECIPIEPRRTFARPLSRWLPKSRIRVVDTSNVGSYPKASKIYSVAGYVFKRCFSYVDSSAAQMLRDLKVLAAKRMAILAVTRPLRFRLRLTQIFTAIRWAKFLAPLLGTFDKLREDVQDFWGKWMLRKRRRRASRAWSAVLRDVVAHRRQLNAAVRIQENFRAERHCQKRVDDLLSMGDDDISAITKIQTRLREKMVEECVECKRTQRRHRGVRVKRKPISSEKRREAREVKKEIRRRAKANRKMLLRPNTQFAVTWKIIKITCVVLEVAQSLLAPYLSGKLEQMTLKNMLEALLNPDSCKAQDPTPAHYSVPLMRDLAYTAAFCSSLSAGVLNRVWVVIVGFLLRKVVLTVHVICFLDVFITFFTGELDKATGVLKPKPFFKRWILPGVASQLLVNPAMNNISELVKKAIKFANTVGPSRVIHTFLALLPVLRIPGTILTDVECSLVQKANGNVVSSSLSQWIVDTV